MNYIQALRAENAEMEGAILTMQGRVDEFLAHLPFAAPAQAPLGEILLADGRAVEVCLETFLDFGQPVEPIEKFRAVLPFVHALV